MIDLKTIYTQIKKYGYIKEMNFSREVEYGVCCSFDLELVLCEYPCYDADDMLSLKFIGVKDLQINDFDNLFRIVLDIVPIFEMQLENLNYSVKEIE
ncbi:MAG: hypothetical protein K2J35_04075, partial [Eubacterium sp.]|nr:hypothetical protein [Eubacterium sp.]